MRCVLLSGASAVALVSAGASTANAAADPSGSGASANTVIYCNSQSHTIWEQTTAYAVDTAVLRRIWIRQTASASWHIYYHDGNAATSGWDGVSSSTLEGQNLSGLAGVKLYVYVEYAFTPSWAQYQPWTYAHETPPIYYYNPYTRNWPRGSYCGL